MMLVRKDIEAMQDDLKTQEVLWHQGVMELQQERATLQAQVVQLKAQVKSGEGVSNTVLNLKHDLATERALIINMREKHAAEQNTWMKERVEHQKRQQDLTTKLQDVESQILAEAHETELKATALQTDQVALRMKVDELTARIKDMSIEDKASGDKNVLQMKDLETQHAEMVKSLEGLKAQLAPPGSLEVKLKALQTQLATETQKVLELQAGHSTQSIECQNKVREVQQVLKCEQDKDARRHQEMLTLCQPVKAQQELLGQQLAACNAPAAAPPR